MKRIYACIAIVAVLLSVAFYSSWKVQSFADVISADLDTAAEAIRKEVLAGYEGMEDDVLLETPLSETLFTGYTRLYVPVVVSAPGHASGEIVRVRLGAYDGERVRAALV